MFPVEGQAPSVPELTSMIDCRDNEPVPFLSNLT